MRVQRREAYWVLAIIPILLAARYLPALAILALTSGVAVGSADHRIQMAALYAAWGALGIAGTALARAAMLGAVRVTVAHLAAPLVLVALSALTEMALLARAFGTAGRFERDTYGVITILPDLGVLTACLVFAVLIASSAVRRVLALVGLVSSLLALWASSPAFAVISDDLTRGLAGLLAGSFALTVLGLGFVVARHPRDAKSKSSG